MQAMSSHSKLHTILNPYPRGLCTPSLSQVINDRNSTAGNDPYAYGGNMPMCCQQKALKFTMPLSLG